GERVREQRIAFHLEEDLISQLEIALRAHVPCARLRRGLCDEEGGDGSRENCQRQQAQHELAFHGFTPLLRSSRDCAADRRRSRAGRRCDTPGAATESPCATATAAAA